MERLNITEDNIDDFIDAWHKSDSKLPLHEYLGLTFDQYAYWVRTGKFIIN